MYKIFAGVLHFKLGILLISFFIYLMRIADRLKPGALKFRRPPAKVFIISNTVIGLSHLCCHNVLYFLNNTSVIFLTH